MTFGRTGDVDVPDEALADRGIVQRVFAGGFESLAGLYAEVGARPASGRVGLVVRYRTTRFSADPITLVRGSAENRETGLRTVGVALTARL